MWVRERGCFGSCLGFCLFCFVGILLIGFALALSPLFLIILAIILIIKLIVWIVKNRKTKKATESTYYSTKHPAIHIGKDHDKYILADRNLEKDYFESNDEKDLLVFTGYNFQAPQAQLAATLILNYSCRGYEIKDNDDYSTPFYYECRLSNPGDLHIWLLKREYLRPPTIYEVLNLYKVPELKIIADSLGCKKSGRKSELINRIIPELTPEDVEREMQNCSCFFPTEKGYDFLKLNEDLVEYHRKHYDITINEFFEYRFIGNKKRFYRDTIFQILSHRANIYEVRRQFHRLELTYWYLSELCYEECRYDMALLNTLYRLYFSTNLASKTFLFDVAFVKANGVKKLASGIMSYETFNKYTIERIVELKAYYKCRMIDIVYTKPILSYTLFDKKDFSKAIDFIYSNRFDADYFNKIIQKNYIAYMKQFK